MLLAVVGANGFLGQATATALADSGHDVTPILRDDPFPALPFDAVVDCNGDARRFWAEQNPIDSMRANVASVASRLTGLSYGRYILVSTVDVYGAAVQDRKTNQEDATLKPETMHTYGFHKYLAELSVRHHSSESLILRLGTLIGPGLRKNPVFDATANLPIRQTPESTISLIDLEHAARAIVLLLKLGATGTYNVTASASITVAEMARRVARSRNRSEDGIQWHSDRLETRYDIAVDKISAHMTMPMSVTMLDDFLASST